MAYADLDGDTGTIIVQTNYIEGALIKVIPGKGWDSTHKVWRLPLSWASCVSLRGVFGDSLTLGDQLVKWARTERQQRIDPALAVRTATTWPADGYDSQLYEFQRAGVEFMHRAGNGLLGDDMGVGKSPQILSLLHNLHPHGLPALIICPNSVKRHWLNLASEWYPEAIPYVIEGTASARRKKLAAAAIHPTALVIINIEAVRLHSRLAPYGSVKLKRCRECDPKYGDEKLTSTRCEVHRKELNDFGFTTVIIDEAHRIKTPQSLQTRAIWAVAHDLSVVRRWALTGTPIANHPGDLWSVMHAVAPLDFPRRSTFMERFCLLVWNNFGGMDVVGIRLETRDELFKILDPRFRRMTKEMVLPQLPAKIREIRWVEMTPTQRRMYNEVSKHLTTRDDTGELYIAPTQLSSVVRLVQLAAASVGIEKIDPDDILSWRWFLRDPSPKIDELEFVLEELGEAPCVIAAEHRQLIDLASVRLTKLNVRHALITGAVSPHDRDRALDDLNAGRIRALLYTVKAGGVGLDMSAADTLINLQRPWSMVDAVQSENRIHRIGSERHESVRIIDVVTRDTIEEDQINRLQQKMARLEEITRDRQVRPSIDLDNEEAMLARSFLGMPNKEEQ